MAEQSYEKALNKYAALSEHDRSSGEQFDAVTASVDLIKVYKKALETTKDFSYRAKAIKLLDKVKQMNESDPDSYSYSENQKLIQDFEGVFENATAKSLKVTSGFLESIEKRMSSIVGEGKDTTGVIVSLEKVIRELEIGHKEGPQNQKLNYLLSVAYGTVSWYYALQKDYPKTLKAAQKGLALDSTQTWIYGNLALPVFLAGSPKIYLK
jgi:tetratricopeptide (TPR) repeat protein